MLSLLTFILRLSEDKEEEKIREELETCYGKLKWYRERYGSEPADIDYRRFYLRSKNQRITAESRQKILKGEAAIENVILWSFLGGEKDRGTFYLSDASILFSGRKMQREIGYPEISSISNVEGAIRIKTRKGETLRFDSARLASYGIDISTLQARVGSQNVQQVAAGNLR